VNNKYDFILESSPWWLLGCALLGAIYAYTLYQKKHSWSGTVNKTLAVSRFLLVSLLGILLLNIFLNHFKNTLSKRQIGIVIDNSGSMASIGNAQWQGLKTALKDLAQRLKAKDIEISFGSFDNNPLLSLDSLKFTHSNTDLAQLINNYKTNTEGLNVSDILLLSDGINNKGLSVSEQNVPFAVHSIAVGDTTAHPDVFVNSVIANNLAYKGNKFEIQADIQAPGYQNKMLTVSVAHAGKVLQTKSIKILPGLEPTPISFMVSSPTVGLNKFTISLQTLPGEHNLRNNTREILVEVIDGRQKILLLASAAHPDLKALKEIVTKNENFELEIIIANQQAPIAPKQKRYDLALLHQLPSEDNALADMLKNIKENRTPTFTIVANQSSLAAINLAETKLKIEAASNLTDKVTAHFNSSYDAISFDENTRKIFEKLPPLTVPYGDIRSSYDIILKQTVGDTPTSKPLLLLNNTVPRSAYLLGEGLWAWRMEEYRLSEKTDLIDDFFSKILQQLSAKDDTRKLKVYPANKEIEPGQPIELITETYNDILQKTYNQKISLKLTDPKGQAKIYAYSNAEGAESFTLSGLGAGMYQYIASSSINGKIESSQGQFFVKNTNIELENLQANHAELRRIATQTGGQFFKASQIAALEQLLLKKTAPGLLQTEEETIEIIKWPWIMALLILLASLEWAARKYYGAY
jgi:hypothetical protein